MRSCVCSRESRSVLFKLALHIAQYNKKNTKQCAMSGGWTVGQKETRSLTTHAPAPWGSILWFATSFCVAPFTVRVSLVCLSMTSSGRNSTKKVGLWHYMTSVWCHTDTCDVSMTSYRQRTTLGEVNFWDKWSCLFLRLTLKPQSFRSFIRTSS